MFLKVIIRLLSFFFPSLGYKYTDYALSVSSIALTVVGMINYPGTNALYYALFSFFSFSLLFNTFSSIKSYFFLYVGTLLWLGFWWKATGLFTISTPLVESTGAFNFSPQSYDKTMLVSSVGIIAAFCSLKFFNYFKLSSISLELNSGHQASFFPKFNFTYCWLGFYSLVFLVSALNFFFGFQQAGLIPRTILPFPLNAVIFFMLSSGFGILASMLIYYQLLFDKKANPVNVLVSMSIVTFLCMSTLSRATIIFYPLAILVAYFFNQSNLIQLSLFKKIKIFIIFILIYMSSFSAVSLLRDYYYFPASDSSPDAVAIWKINGAITEGNKVLIAFKRLLISRWIGYEGVMTSVGNHDNSPLLLLDLISQTPKMSHPDRYLIISKSGLDLTTSSKFNPTTLPGPIGFTYLSGSLAIVFVSIFSLLSLFAFIEYVIFNFFKNPFLCSFYGMVSALIFTQIGLAPVNLLKFYFLFGLSLFVIYFAKKLILRKYFHALIA